MKFRIIVLLLTVHFFGLSEQNLGIIDYETVTDKVDVYQAILIEIVLKGDELNHKADSLFRCYTSTLSSPGCGITISYEEIKKRTASFEKRAHTNDSLTKEWMASYELFAEEKLNELYCKIEGDLYLFAIANGYNSVFSFEDLFYCPSCVDVTEQFIAFVQKRYTAYVITE